MILVPVVRLFLAAVVILLIVGGWVLYFRKLRRLVLDHAYVPPPCANEAAEVVYNDFDIGDFDFSFLDPGGSDFDLG